MTGGSPSFAFTLTLVAGLSTGVGSAIAFFARRTNQRLLCVSLGFSAGVMIYVSMLELLPAGREALQAGLGGTGGGWAALAAFFGGMAAVAGIDRLVPSYENPHEIHRLEEVT
ncbi:MAG: zinc transporter ZupT, partial [Candidatus Krumholzibacteria bacterium]|nr:zinc transporter ZupT [Candidatus Krumholzibacteria bacterium]